MASDSTDEVCVPFVRSDTFINEEQRFRVILLLDLPELIVVAAEKGFLPIEFVSRSLYTQQRVKKAAESGHCG